MRHITHRRQIFTISPKTRLLHPLSFSAFTVFSPVAQFMGKILLPLAGTCPPSSHERGIITLNNNLSMSYTCLTKSNPYAPRSRPQRRASTSSAMTANHKAFSLLSCPSKAGYESYQKPFRSPTSCYLRIAKSIPSQLKVRIRNTSIVRNVKAIVNKTPATIFTI